ncbi:hypothetical protein WOLCODRAFT_162442, partial [Wolfiporia cocos MD-104 SS10]
MLYAMDANSAVALNTMQTYGQHEGGSYYNSSTLAQAEASSSPAEFLSTESNTVETPATTDARRIDTTQSLSEDVTIANTAAAASEQTAVATLDGQTEAMSVPGMVHISVAIELAMPETNESALPAGNAPTGRNIQALDPTIVNAVAN